MRFLLLLASACYFEGSAYCQDPPRKVSAQDARRNLLGTAPVIHSGAWDLKRPFQGVEVSLIIDANGYVRSAKSKESSNFSSYAVALAQTIQYRPFLVNGVAVEVEVDEFVRILPIEKLPQRHVPFPQVDALKSVSFSLERGPCFGNCPSYQLHIGGEGVVTYVGKTYVGVEGTRIDRISPEAVQRLLQSFKDADFFSLDNSYAMLVTDCPRYVIGITIGNTSKTIVDYVGEEVGMPDSIKKLEEEIDTVTSSAKWVDVFKLIQLQK